MSKTELGDQTQEPPIRTYMKISIYYVVIFVVVFTRRILGYLNAVVSLLSVALKHINRRFVLIKRILVRLIMYRGGVFYEAPRLGLAALMSTTAAAIVIVPASGPARQTYSINVLLHSKANIVNATTDHYSGVLSASPALVTTSSGKSIRKEIDVYTIQPGDTLSSIAAKFLVSVDGIKYVNSMSSDFLRPGDEIKIPPVDGLFHIVEDGDTLASIAKKYNVPEQAIADFNALEEPFTLYGGQELIIPNATVPKPEPVSVPQVLAVNQPATGLQLENMGSNTVGSGDFIMPVSATITQYFWWGHTAIDLANSCGTPIFAADGGTVTYAQWWPGGGGNSVWIDHGNGYVTQYAHMSGFAVSAGQVVTRGQLIGYMGTTGRSTGCHVHFVIKKNGVPIDPLSVL